MPRHAAPPRCANADTDELSLSDVLAASSRGPLTSLAVAKAPRPQRRHPLARSDGVPAASTDLLSARASFANLASALASPLASPTSPPGAAVPGYIVEQQLRKKASTLAHVQRKRRWNALHTEGVVGASTVMVRDVRMADWRPHTELRGGDNQRLDDTMLGHLHSPPRCDAVAEAPPLFHSPVLNRQVQQSTVARQLQLRTERVRHGEGATPFTLPTPRGADAGALWSLLQQQQYDGAARPHAPADAGLHGPTSKRALVGTFGTSTRMHDPPVWYHGESGARSTATTPRPPQGTHREGGRTRVGGPQQRGFVTPAQHGESSSAAAALTSCSPASSSVDAAVTAHAGEGAEKAVSASAKVLSPDQLQRMEGVLRELEDFEARVMAGSSQVGGGAGGDDDEAAPTTRPVAIGRPFRLAASSRAPKARRGELLTVAVSTVVALFCAAPVSELMARYAAFSNRHEPLYLAYELEPQQPQQPQRAAGHFFHLQHLAGMTLQQFALFVRECCGPVELQPERVERLFQCLALEASGVRRLPVADIFSHVASALLPAATNNSIDCFLKSFDPADVGKVPIHVFTPKFVRKFMERYVSRGAQKTWRLLVLALEALQDDEHFRWLVDVFLAPPPTMQQQQIMGMMLQAHERRQREQQQQARSQMLHAGGVDDDGAASAVTGEGSVGGLQPASSVVIPIVQSTSLALAASPATLPQPPAITSQAPTSKHGVRHAEAKCVIASMPALQEFFAVNDFTFLADCVAVRERLLLGADVSIAAGSSSKW